MPALPSRRSSPSAQVAASASSVRADATDHPSATFGVVATRVAALFTRMTPIEPSANGCSETVTSRTRSSTSSRFGQTRA